MTLVETIAEARRTGDLEPVVERIPYLQWMGIEMGVEDGAVRAHATRRRRRPRRAVVLGG